MIIGEENGEFFFVVNDVVVGEDIIVGRDEKFGV